MKDFKNGVEDNFPHFYIYSIVDFAQGIYRKCIRIAITKNMWKRLAANHLLTKLIE